jgi:hypothetical protein
VGGGEGPTISIEPEVDRAHSFIIAESIQKIWRAAGCFRTGFWGAEPENEFILARRRPRFIGERTNDVNA